MNWQFDSSRSRTVASAPVEAAAACGAEHPAVVLRPRTGAIATSCLAFALALLVAAPGAAYADGGAPAGGTATTLAGPTSGSGSLGTGPLDPPYFDGGTDPGTEVTDGASFIQKPENPEPPQPVVRRS